MTTDYDWDLSKQAVERLLQAKLSERRALIECFDRLAAQPESDQGRTTFTQAGHAFHTVVLGARVITYTVDHPVRRVHVLSIE